MKKLGTFVTESDEVLKKAHQTLAAEDEEFQLDGPVHQLAKNNDNPDILRKLGASRHVFIRHQVSGNPAAPTDLLLKLIDDKHPAVQYRASAELQKRDALPKDRTRVHVPTMISESEDDILKKAQMHVASLKPGGGKEGIETWSTQVDMACDSEDPDVLHELSKHDSPTIRHHITDNPQTREDTLKGMLGDVNSAVRLSTKRALEKRAKPVKESTDDILTKAHKTLKKTKHMRCASSPSTEP